MKNRFQVVEYISYYAVRDRETGGEHAMGDGVDTIGTPSGRMMRPGSEYFRKIWQRALNECPGETEDAYFPRMRP